LGLGRAVVGRLHLTEVEHALRRAQLPPQFDARFSA
jgi:hypothetical protein